MFLYSVDGIVFILEQSIDRSVLLHIFTHYSYAYNLVATCYTTIIIYVCSCKIDQFLEHTPLCHILITRILNIILLLLYWLTYFIHSVYTVSVNTSYII